MAARLEVVGSFIKKGYPTQKVLEYTETANSTWYNQKDRCDDDKRKKNLGRPIPGYTINSDGLRIEDSKIISILKDYREQKEFLNAGGYQKLKHYIEREHGYVINQKKIYRLCKENNLLLPKRKKILRKRSHVATNRIITEPHQLWELDLKYGYIHGENRFFFIMAIIDVFMRLIVNYHIGLRCTGKDLVFTLKRAIDKHIVDLNKTLVIRSDNGTQMTSKIFMGHFEQYSGEQIIQEFIPPATPNKNAHIEAFNSIIEVEFLQVRYFLNYGQAYKETVEYMDFYNGKRIHSSLIFKTPKEINELYLKGGKLNIKPVKV